MRFPIQAIIIAAAIVLAVIVVLILTGALPGLRPSGSQAANLNMWGFYPERSLHDIIFKYRDIQANISVNYREENLNNFESDLLNALAAGGQSAPDIVVFPSDYLKKHGDKLSPAPVALFSERSIVNQYIDAGKVFLTPQKEVLGIPFYADPLVLYWNKDLFSQNFVTLPPKTWDDFLDASAKITKKDSAGNILVAGAAMGKASNIENAEPILETLLLQSGEKIISGTGEVILGDAITAGSATLKPADSALRFFTDFANSRKKSLSWSGALPEAKNLFVSGKLGMYLGVSGEFTEIKEKNPHLNFGVSPPPQLKDASPEIVSGKLYALAVPKISEKKQAAWDFINFLSQEENSVAFAKNINNVSPLRGALPNYGNDSVKSVFAKGALELQIWPNPDPFKTGQIFAELIENASSGKMTVSEALDKAKAELSQL